MEPRARILHEAVAMAISEVLFNFIVENRVSFEISSLRTLSKDGSGER
jgi:hypothetical protein